MEGNQEHLDLGLSELTFYFHVCPTRFALRPLSNCRNLFVWNLGLGLSWLEASTGGLLQPLSSNHRVKGPALHTVLNTVLNETSYVLVLK